MLITIKIKLGNRELTSFNSKSKKGFHPNGSVMVFLLIPL